jgi:hypothetical protein
MQSPASSQIDIVRYSDILEAVGGILNPTASGRATAWCGHIAAGRATQRQAIAPLIDVLATRTRWNAPI